jgi:F-type H+-transporting ATPase subunit gamma
VLSNNYATLREIEGRLKSIRNIEKITKTMKIVASTKMNQAQRAMAQSRAYGESGSTIFEKAETQRQENGKVLFIVCSSDKGLCGGVHSSLSKAVRLKLVENPEAELVVLGEKCKGQLGRTNAKNMTLSLAGIGKSVPTFATASAIADKIMSLETDYENIVIVYNSFKSAVSYEPSTIDAFSEESIKASGMFYPSAAYLKSPPSIRDETNTDVNHYYTESAKPCGNFPLPSF